MPVDLSPAPEAKILPGSQKEAALRNWLLGRVPTDRWWGWLGPLLVTALGGLLRFWQLDRPHQLVFDETYYVKQAYSLWQTGVEYQWPEKADEQFTSGNPDIYLGASDRTVHPPVADTVADWCRDLGLDPVDVRRVAVARDGSGPESAATCAQLRRVRSHPGAFS